MLGSFRHYLLAQTQGRHTMDRLEERGVENTGRAGRSSLKGRERTIAMQSDQHWICFERNTGWKESETEWSAAHVGFPQSVDQVSN